MNDATLAPTEAQKRDEAIEAALRHADRVRLDWTGQASRYLIQFAQAPRKVGSPNDFFTCELVRAFAERDGIPKPPDSRAWGGVIRRASKAGIIKKIGMTKNVGRHHGDAAVWSAVS